MEHITEQYGRPANLLELSSEDFDKLRPFLFHLGILSRVTMEYAGRVTIQAENPYRSYCKQSNLQEPDYYASEEALRRYQY